MAKRVFDIILSLLLFVVLLPVMLLVGIVIIIVMGQPVLFVQIRPGYQSQPIRFYKFRTMNHRVSDNAELLLDEDRLNDLGKFLRKYSLDELPQLINVIKGDLSFVGPRPLLMKYLDLYNDEQARRHEVKPGITGWAQVNGRNAISWKEKFKLDIWYVDNRSFWLDMKILWLTVLKVLKAEGISGEGTATMTEFMGNRDGDNND